MAAVTGHDSPWEIEYQRSKVRTQGLRNRRPIFLALASITLLQLPSATTNSSMTSILSLSNEIIVAMIKLLYDDCQSRGPRYYSSKPITKELMPLSMTGKRLNDCCGLWIFQKYRLKIQNTPNDHREIYSAFAKEADPIKAQLEHFQKKAPFVKTLIIEDYLAKDQTAESGDKLISDVYTSLVNALEGAKRVTSIEYRADRAIMPLPVWEWITSRNLNQLIISGRTIAPAGALPHPSVKAFTCDLDLASIGFLDVSSS